MRSFLCTKVPATNDVAAWFAYLSVFKELQGNMHNELSFLVCILAKQRLVAQHGPLAFDASAKAQGAPGLDIDVRTADGSRIVAEIKTTEPYKLRDFGANQESAFKKDFAKLQSTDASVKYLFVTSKRAHEVLCAKYAGDLNGISLVLLKT